MAIFALSFAGVSACARGETMVLSLVQSLSPHLFWDVRREDIDSEHHARWLVKRVLEYGRWQDWRLLIEAYGKDRLSEVVTSIRSLDPKAAAFCRAFFSLPPSALRCSTSVQID